MRRRIQSAGGGERAGNFVPGANVLPARAAADPVPPPASVLRRPDETTTRPPLISKMPDPATLPCLSLLGVVKVPVELKGGHTAATLDAKLGAGARFGVRCSSFDTMSRFLQERMSDTGAHFGLLNLLNLKGKSYEASSEPKYLELLPMIRPTEPEPRDRVSMRVLVVDSASARPSRPRDIAVDVMQSATIGDLVDAIREACAVSRDETVLLANAEFKPLSVLAAAASAQLGQCRITHVYTSRDGSFQSKPVRGVKGFLRELPHDSPYEFKHNNRRCAVGRVEPDVSGVRDVLVAYLLPKDAKQLAIVNPTYHFDFKELSADAKKQTEDETAFDAKLNSKNGDDETYLFQGFTSWAERNAWERSKLTIRHAIGTLGIPIVVPATFPRLAGMGSDKWSVGGDAQADDFAIRVKRVLEACVPDAAAAAPAPAGKGKRRAVAGVAVENLPVPFMMHTFVESHYNRVQLWNHMTTTLEDSRSRRKDVSGSSAHWSFTACPRMCSSDMLKCFPWHGSGYQVHPVTAVFDLASMTDTARAAVIKDPDLLSGGAEKHPSAVADDAALPELYRRQSLEDLALARSQRILEELMRASMSFHVQVIASNLDRNPGARHKSLSRWKPFHPLVRTATWVRAARGSSSRAELEIAVYVRNESFAKPADPNEASTLFDGPHASTCRSLLDTSVDCRVGDASNALKRIGGRKEHWGAWYYDPSFAHHEGASGNGDVLHETLMTLFWNDRMREFHDISTRAHARGGARSISEFMRRLEMPERAAARQPPGLAVELRGYQLQSLDRMLELEAAPGGMRHMMWVPLPSLVVGGEPAWFSPFFRVVFPPIACPALPKGGFLCEEMGLGKTVEVLALVLSNPPPADWLRRGDPAGLTCSSPSEHNMSPPDIPGSVPRLAPLRSAATLVVCAVSLVGQWIDEARSKLDSAGGMRVHMYHGQKRIRDPARLANEFDLVVTTYQTIAADRGKFGLNHPTAHIEWYRVVLDEAHMAKSATTAQSKACHELRAARRWACTGTPMGSDATDLHGQLRFLGAYPAQNRNLFDAWFKGPLSRSGAAHGRAAKVAVEVMSAITVRHTKNQTLGGRKILELPRKSETTVEVTLDPGERAKYEEVHAAARARYEAEYSARGDAFISSKLLSIMSLLTPLRRLCSGGNLTAEDLDLDGPQVRRRERDGGGAGGVKRAAGGDGGDPGGGDENATPRVGEGLGNDNPGVEMLAGAMTVDAKPVVPAPADGADKACGVCGELCDSPMRTGCGHYFCVDCLLETTARVAEAVGASRGRGRGRGRGGAGAAGTCECPQVGCRAFIDASAVARGRSVPAEGLAGIGADAPDDDVPVATLGPGSARDAPVADAEPPAEPAVVQFESKLGALVGELRTMRAANSANKALIFSQFTSTLRWLQTRLPEEGFGFRTVSGSMPLKQRAEAIAAFQNDPPTTVFLLSMRSGAVGINLTSATHVFLVEPALNSALTEQAIGRSWRMGQRNEVCVKHLVVKNSVESNIVKLLKARAEEKTQQGEDQVARERAAASTSKMSKSEVAGHLKADRQRLRAGELDLLFMLEEERAPVGKKRARK